MIVATAVLAAIITELPDIKELDRRKETLYLGGSVESTRILLLVRSANPPEASMPVFGDVYLSSSQKALQRLIEKPDKEERFRIYAGVRFQVAG